MVDIGLLGALSDLSPRMIVEGHQLFSEFKGALTENYVAQALTASSNRNLYYWASQATAEVDFIVSDDMDVYPLEVKSGNSTKKKSLMVYSEKYNPSKLIRT